ncbi:MAG: Fic family protein, partial [Akkermansia sp.]
DQAGAKSDQAGAKSDQAGAKSDQAAAKNDQAAIKLPSDTPAPVRELLEALGQDTLSAAQLMEKLGLQHRANFRQRYLAPALACGFVLRTLPDTPNSPNQRYRAADRG